MGNKCFVNVGKKCLTFTKHMQLGYKLSIFNENAFILFFSVTFDSSKDILLLLVNFANLYHTESSFSLCYTKPTRAAMMFCFVTVKQTGKVMIKTGSPSISFRLIMPLPLTLYDPVTLMIVKIMVLLRGSLSKSVTRFR